MSDSSTEVHDRPYLMVSPIVCHVDAAGRPLFDVLWARDLEAHFKHLPSLRLACPVRPAAAGQDGSDAGLVFVAHPFEFYPLDAPGSMAAALLAAPATFVTLWRASRGVTWVHTGLVGWPLPVGWLAAGVAALRRLRLLVVIESAPWRLVDGTAASWKQRLRAGVFERVVKRCLARADLNFYTQPTYLQELSDGDPKRNFVAQATWVQEHDLISDADLQATQQLKQAATPRLLFAGRLVLAKGVGVLLDAVKLLQARGIAVNVDVIGRGEMAEEVAKASAEATGPTRLSLLPEVGYPTGFLHLLRHYQVVLVPSLSDEQPRVVYDAYSQGVPVLASATPGLRACVEDGRTGWLVEPGSAEALATAIARVAADAASALALGREARHMAAQRTHESMHRFRAARLATVPDRGNRHAASG